MEIPGGGDLLRTLPPPELLSGGSPCPVTPAIVTPVGGIVRLGTPSTCVEMVLLYMEV